MTIRSIPSIPVVRCTSFRTTLAVGFAVVLSITATDRAYEYFHAGKTEAVQAQTTPGFLLAGGGDTPAEAYEWFALKSGGGDALTLRASGSGGMNSVLMETGRLNSAASILFRDREAAKEPFVIARIRGAAALFLAGGDQWNYVRMWKGTPVSEAVDWLVAKGVPIGGSSAGLAVLGEFSFSAEHDTVTSEQALADPFHPGLTIADDFLHIPLLKGVITDTHFKKRDRMGRTLAFLARIQESGKAKTISSIAVDEGSAILLEGTGAAVLSGTGSAYFLRATNPPQVCKPGTPLTFRSVAVYRIGKPGAFNVKKWRGNNGAAYTLSVENGVIRSTQAGGSIY